MAQNRIDSGGNKEMGNEGHVAKVLNYTTGWETGLGIFFEGGAQKRFDSFAEEKQKLVSPSGDPKARTGGGGRVGPIVNQKGTYLMCWTFTYSGNNSKRKGGGGSAKDRAQAEEWGYISGLDLQNIIRTKSRGDLYSGIIIRGLILGRTENSYRKW